MAKHQTALWAGVASFFGTLLTIGIFDIFNPSALYEYIGAFLVAGITAGGVYSKQRLDEAKASEKLAGSINMSETADGLVYTLEVNGDPEDLQKQDSVVFKVNKNPK